MSVSRVRKYPNADVTWEEACARSLVAEVKKSHRRYAWVASLMEVSWGTYILPIARIIEALHIQNESDLDKHWNKLVKVIRSAFDNYDESTTSIIRLEGVLPFQVHDAKRYSCYLKGMVDELYKHYSSAQSRGMVVLQSRRKGEEEPSEAERIDQRRLLLEAISSAPLKQYLEETGCEQVILGLSDR